MYWRRSEIYRHWLLEKIFQANSNDSISIMVLSIEEGEPDYRDGDIPCVLIRISLSWYSPLTEYLAGHFPFSVAIRH